MMNIERNYDGWTTVKYFCGEKLINVIVTHGSCTLITAALYKIGRDAELKGFGCMTHVECWWQPEPYDGQVYETHRQWRLEID